MPAHQDHRHFVFAITDPAVIRRILAHLEAAYEGTPQGSRRPPQPTLPW